MTVFVVMEFAPIIRPLQAMLVENVQLFGIADDGATTKRYIMERMNIIISIPHPYVARNSTADWHFTSSLYKDPLLIIYVRV